MASKKQKRITQKLVQATENTPVLIPNVTAKPEIDEDGWGPDGLTLKQRRFCEAYVGDAAGNATKAAALAGYKDDNYKSLQVTSSDTLSKPMVRAYIGRLLARMGATPEFLNDRLGQLSHSSLDNFLTTDETGEVVVDLKQAAVLGALGQAKEIKEETIEISKNVFKRRVTVKVHDPLPAIRTLMEIHGKIVQRHEVAGEVKHTFDDDAFSRKFNELVGGRFSGTREAPANGN